MNPQKSKRSLAVCIPASGRAVPFDWAMTVPQIPNPPNLYLIRLTVVGRPTAEARNTLMDSTLEHECRLLWFIDDDVVPPPDALTKLVYQMENHPEAAMVSAIVCSKQDPPAPCVFARAGDGPFWDWTVGEVFEAPGGVGLACCLIRTEWLERLDRPYCKFEEGKHRAGPSEFPMLVSEDLYFCNKIRNAGGVILVDGSILCVHHDVLTGKTYELPKDSLPWRRAREKKRAEEPSDIQRIPAGASPHRRVNQMTGAPPISLKSSSESESPKRQASAVKSRAGTRFVVVLPEPPGYIHVEALRELQETVHLGLQHLGLDSQLSNRPNLEVGPYRRTNILFGAHLLTPESFQDLPSDTIIYNTEPLGEEADKASFQPKIDAWGPFRVWHMSKSTNDKALALGLQSEYVALGYVREMTRIKNSPNPDVDVLFYGAVTERRVAIIDALRAAGLQVPFADALFGRYGAERDSWIARAKIILNVHAFPRSSFEVPRVVYALSNRKPVVCERNEGEEIEGDLMPGMIFAPYDGLAETCIRFARSSYGLRAIAEAGFDAVRRRDESEILKAALKL